MGSLKDRSARIRPGVESNPDRIEIVMGMATWGRRLCDNPRLRKVSPTGKSLSWRGGCRCEMYELMAKSLDVALL